VYADPKPLDRDVAVVVDEVSLCQIAYGIELGLPLLYDLRAEWNRMGTTPELWLLADYLKGRGTAKKLVIFLNAFSLTAPQRALLRERLAQDGATALWFYAPGVLSPDTATPEAAYDVGAIEGLTGIRVRQREGDCSPAMRCMPGHRFAAGLPEGTVIAPDDVVHNWEKRDEKFQFRQMTYPPRDKLHPLFAVADPRAEVFGHYVDTGEPAMAVRGADGFRSIFVGGLTLPAQVLGNMAADASVHLYCRPGDVVYTDGRLLSITACTAGDKTVALPHASEVTDIFTGTQVTRGHEFCVGLDLGETRVYRIDPVP